MSRHARLFCFCVTLFAMPASFATLSLAIFCKVVDNYGDIGICWRLARQLHGEHGIAVTLWVDDLGSFRRIWPTVDAGAAHQIVDGIAVRHWAGQDGDFVPADIPDVVVEFFGVELPPGYVAAMAEKGKSGQAPVWINYEGLSAEEWVEGCHALPSMHPRLKLTKHFFFPGFTDRTGGLLRERDLLASRDRFQSDPTASAAFLAGLGATPAEAGGGKASLFCYPHAPVAELFDAWAAGDRPWTCLVPDGVAPEQVAAFLGRDALPGTSATRGNLTVRVIPFLSQSDYDRLLWVCDLNFVRGEDSWVRAQWAGRPFVWHIYPQDENLHHVKLRAFLQKYTQNLDAPLADVLAACMLRWNGADANANVDPAHVWTSLQAALPALARHDAAWVARMAGNGDLVSNLLHFVRAPR
jgi:uncharacterized repeat protein (TIGR03837 family)